MKLELSQKAIPIFKKEKIMIDRIAIKNAFDEAMKESKEEYEKKVINTLENYIQGEDCFTLRSLCNKYAHEKYNDSYIRGIILQNLKDIYTGVKEDVPSDVEIVKYQNKFIQGLFNSFDFEYRMDFFEKYKDCHDFADNDIFSQRELLKYEECLKDKEKIENNINKKLIEAARELNKTCEIALKEIIPSTKRSTDDWMIIIIYNYIVRCILNESKLLFETLSSEDDVRKERHRVYNLRSFGDKERKENISYSGYKYKVIGFV